MSESDSLRWRIQQVHGTRCALLPEFDCGKLVSREGLHIELYTHKTKSQVCIFLLDQTQILAVSD